MHKINLFRPISNKIQIELCFSKADKNQLYHFFFTNKISPQSTKTYRI